MVNWIIINKLLIILYIVIINDEVTSGKLDCVIIIKDGFSQSVINGNPSNIEITSIKGEQTTAYIKAYLYNYINNISDISDISEVAKGNEETLKILYDNYRNNDFTLSVNSIVINQNLRT